MYDYRKALESFEKAKEVLKENLIKLHDVQKSMGIHYASFDFNVDDITVNILLLSEEFEISEDEIEIWHDDYQDVEEHNEPTYCTLKELKKLAKNQDKPSSQVTRKRPWKK
jgi:hypothetical protein